MATIYVSGGGTALKDAIASCADGDEIVVADGSYTGGIVWATARKRFRVMSENGPANCTTNNWWFYRNQNSDAVIGDMVYEGLTFVNADGTGGYTASFRFCELRRCIVRGCSNTYNVCGTEMRAYACLFRDNKSTTGRLSRLATFANCSFVENIVANGQLNYNSTFRNCLFAGNVKTAGGDALTDYGSASSNPKCMAGGSDLVDADGRPVAGSPAYGGGSASYLQTAADLAGTPWLAPPSIGCYEFVKGGGRTLSPNDLHPFGGSWKR